MTIAQASNDNCVIRALSTMRLALGYTRSIPKNVDTEIGSKTAAWIAKNATHWFPDHTVYAWHKQRVDGTDYNYMGSVYGHEFDTDNHLIAFAYENPETGKGHMVIGTPYTFGNMLLSFVLAVSLHKSHKKRNA